MKPIGITGGIGSGKSLVSELIKSMGYPVYDADTNSKLLCNTNKSLREKLIQTFGTEIYNAENELNRKLFASIIFDNPEKLKQANAIIHPVVLRDFAAWAARQTTKLVFVESAILLQSPLTAVIDKIMFVFAPKSLRIDRVIEREEVSIASVFARIRHQLSDKEMRKNAHFIVENDDLTAVIPQVEKILSSLLY